MTCKIKVIFRQSNSRINYSKLCIYETFDERMEREIQVSHPMLKLFHLEATQRSFFYSRKCRADCQAQRQSSNIFKKLS